MEGIEFLPEEILLKILSPPREGREVSSGLCFNGWSAMVERVSKKWRRLVRGEGRRPILMASYLVQTVPLVEWVISQGNAPQTGAWMSIALSTGCPEALGLFWSVEGKRSSGAEEPRTIYRTEWGKLYLLASKPPNGFQLGGENLFPIGRKAIQTAIKSGDRSLTEFLTCNTHASLDNNLEAAVKSQSLGMVKLIFSAEDQRGNPLRLATKRGSLKMVKFLLEGITGEPPPWCIAKCCSLALAKNNLLLISYFLAKHWHWSGSLLTPGRKSVLHQAYYTENSYIKVAGKGRLEELRWMWTEDQMLGVFSRPENLRVISVAVFTSNEPPEKKIPKLNWLREEGVSFNESDLELAIQGVDSHQRESWGVVFWLLGCNSEGRRDPELGKLEVETALACTAAARVSLGLLQWLRGLNSQGERDPEREVLPWDESTLLEAINFFKLETVRWLLGLDSRGGKVPGWTPCPWATSPEGKKTLRKIKKRLALYLPASDAKELLALISF